MDWYYEDGGQPVGPVALNVLQGRCAEGRITAETLVWCEGMGDWQAAGVVLPDLFAPAPATVAADAAPAPAPAAEPVHAEPVHAEPVHAAIPFHQEVSAPAAVASDEWYYEAEGSALGPVSRAELRSLVASQRLGPKSRVWADGLADWEAAEARLPELFVRRPPPPAPAPDPAPEAEWYLVVEGQTEGPLGEEALRNRVRDGRLTAATLVWNDALDAWAPAAQTALGAMLAPLAPPARPSAAAPAPAPPAPLYDEPLWHYAQDGGTQGPVSAQQLQEWARQGFLAPDTPVWADGMADWQDVAKALPELFAPGPGPRIHAPVPVNRPALAPQVPPAGQTNQSVQVIVQNGYPSTLPAPGYLPYVAPGFFSLDGRINRQLYYKRIALFFVLCVVTSPLAGIGIFLALCSGLLLLPTQIQRVHDVGKSAWWLFIPFLNFIAGLEMMFSKGTIGPNQYGQDPLIALHGHLLTPARYGV